MESATPTLLATARPRLVIGTVAIGMNSNNEATLSGLILTRVRGVESDTLLRPADFVKDFVLLPKVSRPAGSMALDFTCDLHAGRLMRLWMSPHAGDTMFGGEGVKGAWDTDTDTSGCGAVVVRCTRQGCRRSARLTNEWLMASFSQVQADFEAGKGLPIAWFPLSQVGLPSL